MYLIIGGTKFLGRHLVDSLLARGEDVVLFNRGKFPSDGMPDIEVVHGNRFTDLGKLKGRKWKAVIDTCGYLPESVDISAKAFADAAETYVFISSISAYGDFSRIGFDESTLTAKLTDEGRKVVDAIDPAGDITAVTLGEAYGAMKAACERAAENAMPGRVLNIRPGLIVGPHDPTDRFTYWVMRTAEGGEMLAPGQPDRFVQMIDARDVADWTIDMATRGETGVFSANGRPFKMTMGQMLDEIKAVTGSDAKFSWASEEFLEREGVGPWGEMPLYLPESDDDWKGFLSANIDKALAKGLRFRPLTETVRDTLDWRKTVPLDMRAGITRERERELLDKLNGAR